MKTERSTEPPSNETAESLAENEDHLRALFEDSPISLWEEIPPAVKQFLDRLRMSGVTDLRNHLDRHPETVPDCASKVRVLDVNKATLEMY